MCELQTVVVIVQTISFIYTCIVISSAVCQMYNNKDIQSVSSTPPTHRALKVQCSAFFPTEFGGNLLQSVVSVSSLASELTQVGLSTQRDSSGVALQQSCPWVGLTHGLGWVGSTIAKVLKKFKGLC